MGIGLKSWSSGETLTHTDLNNNFSLIESKLGNLRNADFSDDAGISSNKLLDRYSVSYMPVLLTGDTWGNNVTAEDQATQGSITPADLYPTFPGKRAYLCAIKIHVQDLGDPADLAIYFEKNGSTTLGGGSLDYTGGDGLYTFANSSPFADPIDEFQEGDFIRMRIGKAAGASNGSTFQSLSIVFAFKVELVS